MLDLVVGRAGDDLRPRHEEPGALLALQGRPGGPRDPGAEDLRLDRRASPPSPARRRTSRAPTTRPSSATLHAEPALRRALGQGLRLQDDAGPLEPDPLRQVPAGRPPARQQARGGRLLRPGRGGGGGARQDPGHRLLQPAPRRPHQQALQVRRPGGQGPRLREGRREGDLRRPRQPAGRREDPDRGDARPEGGGPAGTRPVLRLRALGAHRRPDARGPEAARLRRLPEEERLRAARAARGHGAGRGRGPLRPHPPRRDQGDEPRPRYEFVVGLRDDILAHVRASYGETGPVVEEADLGRIINDLGSGEEGEVEGEAEPATPEVDETDSGIVKLCNQIIIDAYNKGASDIHVEPYGKTAPDHRAAARRRRLPEVHRGPRPPPQRPRPAPQDHGQARHRGEEEAPGRQDPLPRPHGHDRAARRHHPHLGRQRGRGDAHPGRLEAAAPRQDGLPASGTSPSSRRSSRSPTASAWWSAPPAPGRRRRSTPRSASSTPRT